MSHFLAYGLTYAKASDICLNRCKAMCCRGELVLELKPEEISQFMAMASNIGVRANIVEQDSGVGWIFFADHPNQHCPMLDDQTSQCRIYENRPQRCRDFPERKVPGCEISGG